MAYKIIIGQRLKIKRESLNLTIENIVSITGISRSSVIKVEDGIAKDIDFYFKYAKAVGYSLKKLMNINLGLVSIKAVNVTQKNSTYLTRKIRDLIEKDFFIDYKCIADVKKELVSNKLIDSSIRSSVISNVFINLRKEGILKSIKKGNKNFYIQ